MRGVVRPVQQGNGEPLKSETSRTPLPIPQELALQLSAAVARWGGDHVVTDGTGRQTSTWAIERAVRSARPKVAGLPEAFTEDQNRPEGEAREGDAYELWDRDEYRGN